LDAPQEFPCFLGGLRVGHWFSVVVDQDLTVAYDVVLSGDDVLAGVLHAVVVAELGDAAAMYSVWLRVTTLPWRFGG
jgi:hypothetical protein